VTLPVIEKARSGELALGTFVFEFATNGIGRLAAHAGAEFVLYDAEHTGWGWETLGRLVATTRAHVPAWIRIPSAFDRTFVSRALDVGASGIMAPMVASAEAAARLVDWAKYPPDGSRGAAFGIAHDDYRSGDTVATMRAANSDTVVICQIETVEGLEAVEEIAAVPGVDVVWVGHFDLTNSMGIPGRFDHPDYLAALDRVAKAAADTGTIAGFMPTSVEQATDLVGRGYRLLAYHGDLWLYQQALAAGLAAIRSAT
jgi:2-dehydro-3-deoxyglucarate aldolase/4-hydroxy-2-oxoheptanedioate aldolase